MRLLRRQRALAWTQKLRLSLQTERLEAWLVLRFAMTFQDLSKEGRIAIILKT